MKRGLTLPEPPPDLAAMLADGGAVAWAEPVVIPTYEPAEPDRYPMYFDRRVYQGSSGRVYPLPFVDRIATEPTDRSWEAVHLENRWLRVMVLPELGGRIHVGYDKVARYDFLYRNPVIKPALVGLAGPWVSGGIEFNWPQHHRPATFLPVEWSIERSQDGTVTVWCSDHDPFTRMRGTHGIRLRPDRAAIDLVVRLHNRTSVRHTFLWWANAAVRVHDDYQSFFPTDVHWVADHARRAVTAFPVADRPYYGVDYPALRDADLTWWRNIPVPTSYMVTGTRDQFFGGYDYAAHAGVVHIADFAIAPGKKQWTWGNSPFGEAWSDLLTDGGGPYIELMSGVFTDNQPDFSWLAPGETRVFTQTWYPIQRIGTVQQADASVAVHLSTSNGTARVGVAVVQQFEHLTVRVHAGEALLLEWDGPLEPGEPLIVDVDAGDAAASTLRIEVLDGALPLLSWRPPPEGEPPPEPDVAKAPALPAEIGSVERLYLTGLHLEQYRHPTRSPLPYWHEALRRDPGDARSNTALALAALERCEYALAERHARRALERLTERNANPRDGEASYVLGLALARLECVDDALDSFAKAAWDRAWAAPAAVETARLHARAGRLTKALDHARAARRLEPDDARAEALEVVLLRRLGQASAADAALAAARAREPLDLVLRALDGAPPRDQRSMMDAALDVAAAGDGDGAVTMLAHAAALPAFGAGDLAPMAEYHRARLLELGGRPSEATAARAAARERHRGHCFPWGADDHDALVDALGADPGDVLARHLLALLLLGAGRSREALDQWHRALADGLQDPVALRTAAVVAVNLGGNPAESLARYEEAISLAPADARLWYESDALLARAGATPADRLARLEPQLETIAGRDDAMTVLAALLIDADRAAEAHELLRSRPFAPWEGGEGRVLAAWDRASIALAEAALAAGRPEDALALLDAALEPPRSLGEARHPLDPAAAVHEVRDRVLRALGREPEPRASVAAVGLPEPDPYFATSDPDLLLFAPITPAQ